MVTYFHSILMIRDRYLIKWMIVKSEGDYMVVNSEGNYMLMNMRSDHELFPKGIGYANEEVKYTVDNLAKGSYTNTRTKYLLNIV